MKTIWNTMVAAAGLLAMGACADLGTDDGAGGGGEATTGEYLFGLTEAQLLSIYPLATEQPDAAAWLELNRAPFACAHYGDLCAMVGESAAQDLTRDALYLALAGASREVVIEELERATAEATRVHAAEPEAAPTAGARKSNDSSVVYSCGNHRLHVETFKNNPLFGARYGEVVCKHQADLGSGIWGGSQDADMEAYVEILGTNQDASASQYTHSLSSPKVYPGLYETVRGECTGTHNGQTLVRATSVN
jgi:hypothetical protein